MFKTLHKPLGLALLAFAATAQAQTELPYTIDFSTSQEGWTALDANDDGKGWTIGDSWQDMSGTTRGNVVYSSLGKATEFNDYYVSPQVALEAGKNYKVKVVARTNDTRFSLSVDLGTDATDASTFQQVSALDATNMGLTRSGWSYTWDGTTTEDHVFAVTKSGTFNVGLHLTTTEASSYSYASIALFSYSIEETEDAAEVTVNTGEEEGGGEVTPTVYDVPYSADLTTQNDEWTILDASAEGTGAGSAWEYSEWAYYDSTADKSYPGYRLNVDWDGTPNDYLISPAINLKAGKTYVVDMRTIKTFSSGVVPLYLAVGTDKADASTFTDKVEITSPDTYDATEYQTANITVDADGVYYLAFHALSTDASVNAVYRAAFELKVDEVVETAAPGDVTDATLEVYDNYIALDWNMPTRDAEGNELPEDAELSVYVYENGELAANCDPNPITGKPGNYCSTGFQAGAEGAAYKLVVEYNGKQSEGIELKNEPVTYDLVPTAITPDTTAVQEYLSNITLTYEQELYFNEMSNNSVTFTNEAGTVISGYAMASGNTLTVMASDPEAIVAAEDGSVATWTVSIPEGLAADETCAAGNFTGGHANAALTLTYKVGKLVETLTPTSVVPSTEEVQEYLSNIAVNFDEEIFTAPDAADGAVTLTNNAEGKQVSASVYASGNTLYIYPAESIEAAEDGSYSYWTVNIPAGTVYNTVATENNFEAGQTNAALTYNYTVGKEVVTPQVVVADPADGSTVEKIETITLTWTEEEYAGSGMTEEKATITNADGETVASFGTEVTEFGSGYNKMVVKLKEAITTDGTYTISFPAGFFSLGESGDRDSQAFTLTYTVDTTTGINGISADRLAGKTVYTIGGQKVEKVNQKGLYIVDGKKVVVK